jgi:hypothetical protein
LIERGQFYEGILILEVNTKSANPGFKGQDRSGAQYYYKFVSNSYETKINKELSYHPYVMKADPISLSDGPRILFYRTASDGTLITLGMSTYTLMKFKIMKNGDLLKLLLS